LVQRGHRPTLGQNVSETTITMAHCVAEHFTLPRVYPPELAHKEQDGEINGYEINATGRLGVRN
jgi:hypothetical protein